MKFSKMGFDSTIVLLLIANVRFLADLTRVKSARACLPTAGAKTRQPVRCGPIG